MFHKGRLECLFQDPTDASRMRKDEFKGQRCTSYKNTCRRSSTSHAPAKDVDLVFPFFFSNKVCLLSWKPQYCRTPKGELRSFQW